MRTQRIFFAAMISLASSVASVACNGASGATGVALESTGAAPLGYVGVAPGGAGRAWSTDALIFNGTGTAGVDAQQIAEILDSKGKTWAMADSAQLDAMSVEELAKFGMIVWPGGYAGVNSSSLSAETRVRIRQAVSERGVSFIGFCAGAFIAVSPAGEPQGWGLGLVNAPTLDYFPLEDQGVTASMVPVKLGGGTTRELLWYGGPQMHEWPGTIVGRYADGAGAISQLRVGQGVVVLSGPHPEGPQSWRDEFGLVDSDGLDFELAWQLMDAALNRVGLPTV